MLKHKTRGNSNPQGKAKVYFCCHPEDFEKYFETVSEEILAKQDCAVFFESDALRDEEYLSYLKEMQMFVMPVTRRLLCSDNYAVDIEFKFAIENFIPVLPIMQEEGLVELFSKKCGDLQFLDKTTYDITAISYDEKLERYLSCVLIGDELAEKIRMAFDAYIFLSYRKKDREYANELMRMIHKNELCRDFAIWYDEFLVPGENFNESIKENLLKSNLFMLAVTPNLINEENYIMTHEYPVAKGEGKLIFPVELLPTDREILAEKYPGIPECTAAKDAEVFSVALSDTVKKIALRQTDKSPEHNFFIGLAYLGGVDVEVDYERAARLIGSAADAGIIPAVDKLVDMYNNGYGVGRNYEKAICWQEQKISTLLSLADKDIERLICAYIDCGDMYYNIGKPDKALEKYLLGQKCTAEADSHTIKAAEGRCYSRIGDAYKAEGNIEAAMEAYEKSLKADKELVAEYADEEAVRKLFISYIKLGDIYRVRGNVARAYDYYATGHRYCKMIMERNPDCRVRMEYSISCDKLGSVCRMVGEYDEACGYYEESLSIREALYAEKRGAVEAKRLLGVSYNKLANLHYVQNNNERAKEYFEKDIEIALALAAETDAVKDKRCCALAYFGLGNAYADMGKTKIAAAHYVKALNIFSELEKMLGTVETKADLGHIYYVLAKTQPKDAFLFAEKGMAIYKELCGKCPGVEKYRNMLWKFERLKKEVL